MPREVMGFFSSPWWKIPWRDQEKEPEQPPPFVASSEKRAKHFTVVPQAKPWPPSVMLPGITALPVNQNPHLIRGRPTPQTKLSTLVICWGSEATAMVIIWGFTFPVQTQHLHPWVFFSSICNNSGTTGGSSCQRITCRPKICVSALECSGTLKESPGAKADSAMKRAAVATAMRDPHQGQKLQYARKSFNLKWRK